MPFTLGFQGSLSERDTAVFVTLEEVPNGGGASSFVTYMTKTDYDGNWEIDLATAATYLGASKLLMEHRSTIKAIANAVDEAGNITAGSIATYIMQSDHNAGLLWPNPNELAISNLGSTDTAINHLVTDTTRDLIGGVDLLTGTEVMLTLSDNTGNTGTYTVFAQSDGRYTLDFEDSNTYTEEAGSTFDMTTLTHGAQVTAIINSTDGLGNVYTYDSASSDDGVQQDSSDDLAYEFEMALIAPAFNTNFVRTDDYDIQLHLDDYVGIDSGDWDGDGKDELFAVNQNGNVEILFFDQSGTILTHSMEVSTAGTNEFGLAVGDFNGDGRDDFYAISLYDNNNNDYIYYNTGGDIAVDSSSGFDVAKDNRHTEAMDFDGDGYMDLLVSGGKVWENKPAYIYYGGNGGFTRTQQLALFGTSNTEQWLEKGTQFDVDGDGDLDGLFRNSDGDLTILFNQGSGNDVVQSVYTSPDIISDTNFLTGDFDGDGTEEILTVDNNFYPMLLSYDKNSNSFTVEKSDLASGSLWLGRQNMISLDYDGDGDLDVLAPSSASSSDLHFWSNDGTGMFTDQGAIGPQIKSSNYYLQNTYADLDGDGQDELIIYDNPNDQASVITGTNQGVAPVGNSYFEATNDKMRVYFKDVKAGDTIEITQNNNNVAVNGTYTITTADITNGYADIELDLTNVNDGANVAFDVTLADSLGIYNPVTQTVEIDVDVMAPMAPAVDLGQGANDNYIITDPPAITGTHNDDFDYLRITVSDGTNIATYEPTFIDPAGTWTLDIATATPVTNNGADPDYVEGGQININLSAHENTGKSTSAAQAVDFEVSLAAPAFNTNFVRTDDYDIQLHLDDYVGIDSGDWDGDGKDELFAVNQNGNVEILFFDQSGTILTHSMEVSTAGTSEFGLAVGDFNGDGRDDFYAISLYNNNNNDYIYYNTGGDIAVDSSSGFDVAKDNRHTEAMDFDGDGYMDLLVSGGKVWENKPAYIYYGGNGGFTRTQQLALFGTSNTEQWLEKGTQFDVDGDGDLDGLFRNSDGDLTILFNQGSGNDVVQSVYTSPDIISDTNFLTGDFDGDGTEEILTVDNNFYPMLLSYDKNSNSFTVEKSDLASGSLWLGRQNMISLDYDGDGDLDVLAPSSASSSDLHFWSNDGTGMFTDQGAIGPQIKSSNYYLQNTYADLDGDGQDELIIYDNPNDQASVITATEQGAAPANGLGYFDAANDKMRVYFKDVKAGDTIEIIQGANNVTVNGTYTITAADVTNGYAEVELDFTNVADGTGIAFEITLTDINVGRAPVTTTANIDVLPSATPIMAPTQPVYDAGDPLPVNDTVTNQPVGDANGDGVIDAADNHEFTIWFKENASDPSAIEEDDIITFTNLATGEQSAASYVVTSADVQNGYANVLAEFTTGTPASTNLSDLQIQIEDHNTGNIVVFYGDHNKGNMYVHQAGSIATKHFILDVDGDTDVIASGEFNVHTDSLDLGSLLNGFVRNTGNGDLWDDLEAQGFVKKSGTTDTTIEIDVNGTGNYTHAVTIEGIDSTNLDEDNLDL